MAAIMLPVAPDAARILHEIDVPGEFSPDPHVTVISLGDGVSVTALGDLVPVIHGITAQTNPFSVLTRTVSTFPSGDNGTPVIALVESPALHDLRDRLCQALDEVGFEYDKTFPEFKPHVTLTYAPKDQEVEFNIPAVSWGAHEITLWGANRGQGTLQVRFPFSVPMSAAASTRAAIKLASWSR